MEKNLMSNVLFCNDVVRERFDELAKYAVSAGLRKSREYAEQNSLKVIAGIAGAGILLGMFLSAGRKNRG